jgi:hypothetical protein
MFIIFDVHLEKTLNYKKTMFFCISYSQYYTNFHLIHEKEGLLSFEDFIYNNRIYI